MAEGSTSSGNSSASKSLMWMMIALFTGLAALLGGSLFVASRAVRSMGLSASVKDTIRTPSGGFRLEKETEVGPGLPIYPNSSLMVPDDNTALAAIKQAQNGIEISTYHTTDSRDFVDSWYTKHLSGEFTRHDAGEKPVPAIFVETRVPGDDIAFLAERDQMARIVALSVDSGGTIISLIRLQKSPAPDKSSGRSQ